MQEGLRGMGRPYEVLQAEFGGLIVTVLILTATLRPLGIMGAAIASFLGYGTVCLVLLVKTAKATSLSLSTLLCPSVAELHSAMGQLGRMTRDVIGLTLFKREDYLSKREGTA
jgi:hypothetical protein